jgi:RNA polymerase sigma factor (sigma-70 family)
VNESLAAPAPPVALMPPDFSGAGLSWSLRSAGSWRGFSAAKPGSYTVPAVEAQEADQLEAERLLCEQARAGDRAALGTLLRRYGPRLYRSVLLPRLGSAPAAEEALSVTYMKVVERFAQFSWQSVGVYPWLRVVALRVALDQLRARKREVLFEPVDLERELDAAELEPRHADVLEQHDLALARGRVERLLGRINPRYAQAIRMRVLEERSREEAARELDVSVSTFDVVLHRAMAALRKALSAEGEP